MGTNKIKLRLCSFSKRNPDERLFAKKLKLLRFFFFIAFLDNLEVLILKGKSFLFFKLPEQMLKCFINRLHTVSWDDKKQL